MTLKEYFENKNRTSNFAVSLSEVGGNITFSNSGKRGAVKSFTLGLESFITTINDIKENIIEFQLHKEYIEKNWRDLGSEYYSDGPANAMSTVQTKPLFTTLSKIIAWANMPKFESIDTDQNIELSLDALENAIIKLEELSENYRLQPKLIENTTIPKEVQVFYSYLYKSLSHRKIQESILGMNAPVNRGGYLTMEILHNYEIKTEKKGILAIKDIDEEIKGSSGKYLEALSLVKKYYYDLPLPEEPFNYKIFKDKVNESGLIFSETLIQRFIASLSTKPFVLLTGLSGSGKTKLAQAFVQWISHKEQEGEKNEQYCIVPVGADWTNREPVLGYPNALNKEEYVAPENGVLDLIIRAKNDKKKPYFLILDEMNLSHVERYFADFLSAMESGGTIPLHKINSESIFIPQEIKLPNNLFIIGTVNIDETTYMFSPKVLDRANTIEFRLTEKDLEDFINNDKPLNMELLKGEGFSMGESFVEKATQKLENKNLKQSEEDLKLFFSELKKSGAEFGYRTASEIGRLMFMLEQLGEKGDNLLDIAIMQKLLPKLHGSRTKLTKVLPVLGGFCLKNNEKIKEDYLDKFVKNELNDTQINENKNIRFKISFEKICRMYKNAVENGFASYAEA
jgi:energy-coupling factor transporter ATP-binding protein EcfA2